MLCVLETLAGGYRASFHSSNFPNSNFPNSNSHKSNANSSSNIRLVLDIIFPSLPVSLMFSISIQAPPVSAPMPNQAYTSTPVVEHRAVTMQKSINALELLAADSKHGLDLIGQCCAICRIFNAMVEEHEFQSCPLLAGRCLRCMRLGHGTGSCSEGWLNAPKLHCYTVNCQQELKVSFSTRKPIHRVSCVKL